MVEEELLIYTLGGFDDETISASINSPDQELPKAFRKLLISESWLKVPAISDKSLQLEQH